MVIIYKIKRFVMRIDKKKKKCDILENEINKYQSWLGDINKMKGEVEAEIQKRRDKVYKLRCDIKPYIT